MSQSDNASKTVRQHAGLLQHRAWLAGACALAAVGRRAQDSLAELIGDSLADDAAVPAIEMREALLQTMLFGGYPTALNALGVWHHVMARNAADLLATLPTDPLQDGDPAGHRARGEINARHVYGKNLDKLQATARSLSPDLAEWMIVEGYGRVLGRESLPFATRELCVVATLVPLDTPRQLFSHIKGCQNLGLTRAEITAVVELAVSLVTPLVAEPPDVAASARDQLRNVLGD